MTESLGSATIERLATRLREPAWVTELRRAAWRRYTQLPWPHTSDDVWRRTDVTLLDPLRECAPVEAGLHQRIAVSERQLADLTRPLGDEQLLVRANGAWLTEPQLPQIVVEELAATAGADPIRRAIEADGLTDAEHKLTSLNLAFHHDDLVIRIPAGYHASAPLRLVRLFSASAHQALFPLTVMTIGAGSTVTIIDEAVSVAASSEAPHLVNGRTELILERDAVVHYVRLQRWHHNAREFHLQRATLAEGARLTAANITLGAALSKAHLVTKLSGERATARLYGFVFGHGDQHVDQHTLQDHHAPHTESDLQFKAALQDRSRMIYTGLIRIAKAAAQTRAYQANHNLLLSDTARAATIPMLEILADDVQCKHGASIGPIDEEQTFYLRSRGLTRAHAQRLLVMGFIEPIIQQIPFEPLQQRLREEIEGGLHPEPGQGTGDEGWGNTNPRPTLHAPCP